MDINYQAIGRRVRAARTGLGIKQEALAEKIDISTPHMSNIETGKTKLSLPTLVALANALGVTVDALLRDNIVQSGAVIEEAAAALLAGSTGFERRVMLDAMQAVRDSLRANHRFIDV